MQSSHSPGYESPKACACGPAPSRWPHADGAGWPTHLPQVETGPRLREQACFLVTGGVGGGKSLYASKRGLEAWTSTHALLAQMGGGYGGPSPGSGAAALLAEPGIHQTQAQGRKWYAAWREARHKNAARIWTRSSTRWCMHAQQYCYCFVVGEMVTLLDRSKREDNCTLPASMVCWIALPMMCLYSKMPSTDRLISFHERIINGDITETRGIQAVQCCSTDNALSVASARVTVSRNSIGKRYTSLHGF